MPDKFSTLAKAHPGATATNIYTTPAATQTIIRSVRLVNPDSTPHPITLYQNGSANGDVLEPQITLQPGDRLSIDIFVCMQPADYIAAKSDASAAINVFLFGLEIA